MKKLICVMVIAVLAIIGYAVKERLDVTQVSFTNTSNVADQKINKEAYHKNGIDASYPQFVISGEDDPAKQWNQIMYDDFQKILQIYSLPPIPGPTPSMGEEPTVLHIDYEVKLNNEHFISILYRAVFRSPYAAHPTELVYTTNIDKEKSERVRLPDIIQITPDFPTSFRHWKLVRREDTMIDLNPLIIEYVNEIKNEDLLRGFQDADRIESGNSYGIYSYLTPYGVGISISLPNFLGDHAEFEQEYSEVEGLLR
jgi:hypothetical protein